MEANAHEAKCGKKVHLKERIFVLLNYILIDGLWLCGIIYMYIYIIMIISVGFGGVSSSTATLATFQNVSNMWEELKKKVVWLYYVHPLSNKVELKLVII